MQCPGVAVGKCVNAQHQMQILCTQARVRLSLPGHHNLCAPTTVVQVCAHEDCRREGM